MAVETRAARRLAKQSGGGMGETASVGPVLKAVSPNRFKLLWQGARTV